MAKIMVIRSSFMGCTFLNIEIKGHAHKKSKEQKRGQEAHSNHLERQNWPQRGYRK